MRLPGLAAQRRALDPEETRELTQHLQRLFDEAASLHGGVADRLSGDRLVAVFGLENLTGNEPQRALRAAQSIIHAVGASDLTPGAPAAGIAQGALLPTRIDGPFPLSGDPMSDAESLAGQANPGEVLLSEGLRRALGAHNLPFAGRQAELSLMNSLLERCVATRRGRTIVTRGDAGIGKTRLLEALMDAARCARHRLPSRAGARLRPGQGAPPAGRAVREPARRRGRRRARGARPRGDRGDRVRPTAGRQHPGRERPRRRAAVRGPGLDRAQRGSAGARARPHDDRAAADRVGLRAGAAPARDRGPALRRQRGGGAARRAGGLGRRAARAARAVHASRRGSDRRRLARAGARLPAHDARPRAAHGRGIARARGELSSSCRARPSMAAFGARRVTRCSSTSCCAPPTPARRRCRRRCRRSSCRASRSSTATTGRRCWRRRCSACASRARRWRPCRTARRARPTAWSRKACSRSRATRSPSHMR